MKEITIVYIQERIPRTSNDVLHKPKVFEADDTEEIKLYFEAGLAPLNDTPSAHVI